VSEIRHGVVTFRGRAGSECRYDRGGRGMNVWGKCRERGGVQKGERILCGDVEDVTRGHIT